MKSRNMRWATHLPRMAEMRNVYKIFVENLKGKCHLQDLGMDLNVTGLEGFDWVRLTRHRNQ